MEQTEGVKLSFLAKKLGLVNFTEEMDLDEHYGSFGRCE